MPNPLLFKIESPPPPLPVTSKHHPQCSFCCHVSLAECVIMPHLMSYFTYSLCPLFSSNFYFFTKWQPFKNYEKCFLFHLKCTFHSWDIYIFVYLSFPFFLPAGHCFKGWSKINLKSWCHQLSENLITHFVWYLVKGKRHDVETLSIDRVSDKEHCYRKIIQKRCSKS